MHAELGVPVSFMGMVSMLISGGTVVSGRLSDRLIRKLGTPAVTVASVFLTVLALFGFSFSNRFWMLLVFATPYGPEAGTIDVTLNNYVILCYKAKHMRWLHCFWGVGSSVSPFILGFTLSHRTRNSGYRIVGFLQLGIALLLTATLPVWKANKLYPMSLHTLYTILLHCTVYPPTSKKSEPTPRRHSPPETGAHLQRSETNNRMHSLVPLPDVP